jgi:hypothetical protein
MASMTIKKFTSGKSAGTFHDRCTCLPDRMYVRPLDGNGKPLPASRRRDGAYLGLATSWDADAKWVRTDGIVR